MAYTDFVGNDQYKKGLAGSHAIIEVLNGSNKVIARGLSVSYNDGVQQIPIMELGKQRVEEIVTGQMTVGQLQIQTLMTFEQEDMLPTWQDIQSYKNMKGVLKVVDTFDDGSADNMLPGKELVIFENVHFQAKSGQMSPQAVLMRNVTMVYTNTVRPKDNSQNNQDLTN